MTFKLASASADALQTAFGSSAWAQPMNVCQRLDRLDCNNDEFRSKVLLQTAVTEAFTLLNSGKPEEAITKSKNYADLAAQSTPGCYFFGLIYFNAGDLREALSWFDRAIELQPDSPEALSARAVALHRLGQPLDALASFEELVKLRPHDAEAFFSMGVLSQGLGRMNDALAAYGEALRFNPAHYEAWTNRGALLDRFGRHNEALSCFDAVYRLRPGDSANLFNRGSVLQKVGRHEDALVDFEEASRRGPPNAKNELNRGTVLQRLGRLEEALAAYDLASQYRHGYPQALYNKGIALQGLGRLHEALAAYDAALALDPSYYEASCKRGKLLHDLGRHDDALAACTYTLRIRPGFLPALTTRANILLRLGRAGDALVACDEALRRDRANPHCLRIRGAALHELGHLERALSSLDEALRLNPSAPDTWLHRGNILQEFNRHPEAVTCYHEALALQPCYPEALSGLGVALKEANQIDESLTCFDEALKHKPDYPDARHNRGSVLLLKGRLREGFEDFESRWDRSNAPPKTLISDVPKWEGQQLTGQKIIVWDEQGLGDLIQFSRYLLCLHDAGADVTLLCRKNMHRLLHTLPAPVRLIHSFDGKESFAFQSALMSLPYGFHTNLKTVPAPVAYLHPEPALIAKWAERIGVQGFRIGVAWQGNKFIDLQRSIPLACFAPLAAIEGVRLISLMKDQASIEVNGAGGPFTIESLGSDFDAGVDSFVDCAAAMENLDLVVTLDTAITHLAGALGRPVFVALKKVPDWRWLLNREDCPWYPTMQLFRQVEKGEWEPVFERIAARVEARIVGKDSRPADRLGVTTAVGATLLGGFTHLQDHHSEDKGVPVTDAAKLASSGHELAQLRKLKVERGLRAAHSWLGLRRASSVSGFPAKAESAPQD